MRDATYISILCYTSPPQSYAPIPCSEAVGGETVPVAGATGSLYQGPNTGVQSTSPSPLILGGSYVGCAFAVMVLAAAGGGGAQCFNPLRLLQLLSTPFSQAWLVLGECASTAARWEFCAAPSVALCCCCIVLWSTSIVCLGCRWCVGLLIATCISGYNWQCCQCHRVLFAWLFLHLE